MKYLQLIRIHQWMKNLFLFLPIFFGAAITNWILLCRVSLGFLAFSMIASIIYILNDYLDIEKDKMHPIKSQRPLAAGKIRPINALQIACCLSILGFSLSYYLGLAFLYIVLIYFFMNVLYSKYLKNISLLDIYIIAVGFLLRVFAGSILSDVALSKWLIIMIFLLALFVALAKRRDDVLLLQKKQLHVRAAIKGYNLEFINVSMVMMASVIIVAYLMYSFSAEVSQRLHYEYTYLPVFWLIAGILRYFQLTFVKEQSADPTKILLKDAVIMFIVTCWIITNFILIYY
jgi:4-hydroxybenzoate polyprenyltransferase